MRVTTPSDLSILTDRLLPDKFKGTTYEKLISTLLKNLNPHHQLMNNFLNQIDVDAIETTYGDEELFRYSEQYLNILIDILKIQYPNIVKNGSFTSTTPSDFWGTTIDPVDSGSFFFSSDKYVQYTHNAREDTYNELFQQEIFSTEKLKYEIRFTVEEISNNAFEKIEVFAGTEEPLITITETGSYSARVDFTNTTRSTTRNDALVFKANTDYKMKDIVVTEYERISTKDLALLASELVRNKGRLEAYTLLFDMLNDLGSQSNLDTYIKVDEFDNYEKVSKPRVIVSEISTDVNRNIMYSELDSEGNIYTFDGAGDFEQGKYFLNYDTEFDGDLVVPFVYKVEATFDEQVFKEYIMPVAHPIGWQIIYEIYSLLEYTDKVQSLGEEYVNYRELQLPLDQFFTAIETGNPVPDQDQLITIDGDQTYSYEYSIEDDTFYTGNVIEQYIIEYQLEDDTFTIQEDEETIGVAYSTIEDDTVTLQEDEETVSLTLSDQLYDNVETDLEQNITYFFGGALYGDTTDQIVYGENETRSYFDTISITSTLMVRYIRDWTNGSTVDSENRTIEIQAIGLSTLNLSDGITPTTNADSSSNLSYITDGDTTSSNYASMTSSSDVYVEIDLGSNRELEYIQVWHYYDDNRTFHNTKTEVSVDGVNWVTLFDSSLDGEYPETSEGRITYVNQQ